MQRCLSYFLFIILFSFTCQAWAKLPYYPIQFPRDDASHHIDVPYSAENMTEWWYYNGRLTTKNGRKIGYYLNYMYIQFQIGKEKLMVPTFMLQITDPDHQKVYGKTIVHPAHLSTKEVDVSIGKNATLKREGSTFLLEAQVSAEQNQPALRISLKATPTREPLFVNETGLIDMMDNANSYYYSYSRLDVEGFIQIGDEIIQVTKNNNRMWMDHQWGDFVIQPGQHEWFFTLVQLDDGSDVLAAVPYDGKNKRYQPEFGFANVIMPDNKRIYLKNPGFFAKEIEGEKHPQYYELSLAEVDLKLSLKSWMSGQDKNWISESASDAQGTFQGRQVSGTANIESTVVY